MEVLLAEPSLQGKQKFSVLTHCNTGEAVARVGGGSRGSTRADLLKGVNRLLGRANV